MGLFGPNPNKINPATGRPHKDDKRLYALRDREVAKMTASHKKLKRQIQQDQSRRKSWWN